MNGEAKYFIFSHGANNARGVIILVRNGFDYNVDTVKIDSQGRFLVVKGKIQDVEYTVVNIYAPNKDACSRTFFENLQRVLSEFGINNEDNVIIGGDFNCPLSRNDLPVSFSARLDGQKQSFLFPWDSKWSPSDKGVLSLSAPR